MKGIIAAGLTVVGVYGAAAAYITGDGIKGCVNKDGRAHWEYDDGSISEKPVQALQFSDDGKTCYFWHGGGVGPTHYPRRDI